MVSKEVEEEENPPKKNRLKKVIFISTFIFLLMLILILFFTSTVFILLQQNIVEFINPNFIFLPAGKLLYDLNTFTFRDHELYRYESQILVLSENVVEKNEDEDDEDIVVDLDENEVMIISTSSHRNNLWDVKCQGDCECWLDDYEEDEEDEERKSLTNLVYSYKYTSIVAVSILSFATSRFIDQHSDECYRQAKTILGDLSDVRSRLVCNMKGVTCADDFKDEFLMDSRSYLCNGHCLMSNKLTNVNAIEEAKKFKCEGKWTGPKRFEVYLEDIPKPVQGSIPWSAAAEATFRKNFLSPYCKTFDLTYLYEYPNPLSRRIEKKNIRPCVASAVGREVKNVKCEFLGGVGGGVKDKV